MQSHHGSIGTEREVLSRLYHVWTKQEGGNPGLFLSALLPVVENRKWEDLGKSFRVFIYDEYPKGLGFSEKEVEALLEFRHRREAIPEFRTRMDNMRADIRLELGKAPPPGKRPKEELGEPEQLDITYNISNINRDTLTGTSRNYTIRRLKSEGHEELANKVARKEISANAAAIEVGFRKKTITVTLEPRSIARTLTRHLSGDQINDLIVELGKRGRDEG